MLDKNLCLKQGIFEVTITIRKSANSKNIAAWKIFANAETSYVEIILQFSLNFFGWMCNISGYWC